MIDLTLMNENPDLFIKAIHKKDPSFDVNHMLALDKEVRSLNKKVEELRHQKNELAQAGKQGITPELRTQSLEVGKELKEKEDELAVAQTAFKKLYLRCPNVPLADVPEGNKEENKVIKTFGQKPTFNFPIKNHLELGTSLGWFDFEAAALMAKSNFVLYKHEAVKLMYALIMYMLKHNASFGYSYVLPPYLINEKSLEVAGIFPKFYEDVYSVTNDNLYLIPTAEPSLANLYRDTIIPLEHMPIRLTAATGCFRREAGGYGAHERGLIRIHQFEKVELFTYCTPEESAKEQERMIECAEKILQNLGLHYRISLLAAQDCSFASAKTYDLEVWLPGQDYYKEVSSISNCTDFQSRRGSMRYRKEAGGKTSLVYTLNGSSLALPRLMAALMETYQQADGSIVIPDVLKPWLL